MRCDCPATCYLGQGKHMSSEQVLEEVVVSPAIPQTLVLDGQFGGALLLGQVERDVPKDGAL